MKSSAPCIHFLRLCFFFFLFLSVFLAPKDNAKLSVSFIVVAVAVAWLCITLRCAPGNNLVKSYFRLSKKQKKKNNVELQLKLFAFNTHSPTQRRLSDGVLTWNPLRTLSPLCLPTSSP